VYIWVITRSLILTPWPWYSTLT